MSMIMVHRQVVTQEQPWFSFVWGTKKREEKTVVLELNNSHSFSSLLLQILKRRLGPCVALVLNVRDADSSGNREIFVVFALSSLLPLVPRPG